MDATTKYLVVVGRNVVGEHRTKKAAHGDGRARRNAGEDAYVYDRDTFETFIASQMVCS